MSINEKLETLLADIKPMLESQGRGIKVAEASEERIVFNLSGFCGGCGCSSAYIDGLRDMVGQELPDVKDVQFEVIS